MNKMLLMISLFVLVGIMLLAVGLAALLCALVDVISTKNSPQDNFYLQMERKRQHLRKKWKLAKK